MINQFKERGRWVVLAIFILLNSYAYFHFSSFPVKSYDDQSKKEVHEILSDEMLSSDYIYVVLDWGMYTYQALYGNRNQTVLYFPGINSLGSEYTLKQRDIDAIKGLSLRENKPLLFIHRKPDPDNKTLQLLDQNFVLQKCSLHKNDRVWKILLENNTVGENICLK